jgi:hypothetical protein
MANRGYQLPCECGCGELTFGVYKRGHRRNPPGTQTEPANDGGDAWEPITISDAADMTPDDPSPGLRPESPVPGSIKITKRVRDDVQGKLAFMLSMVGAMASIGDPVCGGAFLDNADNVAAKMTPIICKSPDMVAKLTKSGDVMLYVDLLWAFWPILGIVATHHFRSKREPMLDGTMPPMDQNFYTAG